MRAQELRGRLRPQKHSARETPHVVLETNTSCNIRCKACYAVDRPKVKPFEQLRRELDVAQARRNLDAVSLLGGEPTLHPRIVDVVREVKARGLNCLLLTNGVRFLDGDEDLLDALVAAGVDRVMLHVDAGQEHVHDDLEAARQRLFAMLDARRVYYGLSLTLYPGQEDALPAVSRGYAEHPYFDGALVTLAQDFDRLFDGGAEGSEADMAAVHRSLAEELGVDPAAYIPSSLDDGEISWLMYFYWINARTGRTLPLSPQLNQAMKAVYRRRRGHQFFADTVSPGWRPATVLASGLAEVAMRPWRALRFARLLAGSRATRELRLHYLVVQRAPRWHAEREALEICWQCPDATVRGDELVPVCLAGRLAPLAGDPTAPPSALASVRAHLREAS